MSNIKRLLYKIAPFIQGDFITDAKYVEVTGLAEDNVQESLGSLNNRTSTLENTNFNSGRSFVRFNNGFTINRNNLATFEDKNIIYTASNDKPITSSTAPDVVLPNDIEITASGESYPIVFEFTHLGGTTRTTDGQTNVVRFFVDGVMLTPSLFRDDIAIITKTAAGVDYTIQTGGFDPNDTLLPSGVFNLKTDTPINDITTIATELANVVIVAGDAYLVETGGTWSGLTVPDNSILVATVNSASLADSLTNNDWLLLDNPRVNAKSAALLSNFVQDGIAFNSNRNVQVDPANVSEFNSIATGTPITRQLLTNSTGSNRQIRFDNVPIQFTDLVGGKLQILIRVDTITSSGFPIEPLSIVLYYSDDIQFTFPLTNVQLDSGDVLIEIDIPNSDYSAILNSDVSLRFNFNFRGVVYNGNYTISSVMNMAKGRLHDAVVSIADQRSALVRAELSTRIDSLIGEVDDESRSLEAISDRISPYENLTINTPDANALFDDSSGVDAFPSDLSTLNSVSASNPRYTANSTFVFIAAIGGVSHALRNITQDSILVLDDSDPNVELGESVSFNNTVYFVYRVSGITSGDVIEVERTSVEQVVAWQNDIDNLEADVNRIDAELSHAALNLPDAVVHVLENEVTVTEESNPTVVSTDYNNQLAGTSNTTQTVFAEASPNAPSSGTLTSKPIIDTTGTDRYRNKLLYFPEGTTYTNSDYVWAFDGSTQRTLVSYINGTFNAKVFVPSIPGGTATSTLYPAQSTRVSGAGIWQNIPALTFVNGVPTTEADEIFFTRNVPATSVPVTIQYRGHANGNIFGTNSIILPANQDTVNFSLSVGSETATVEVFRTGGNIRVSVTEYINTGLPTINDVEVILSYTESRVVPLTPATTRDVPIEFESENGVQVFAIKASSTGTLILVGDNTEIDTGYAYTTLFAAGETGTITISTDQGAIYDYEDFEPISSTIQDLENHATLPQFGLFSTEYTYETIVNLDTSLNMNGLAVLGALTTTERDAFTIASPIIAAICYNTTKNEFNFYENGSWVTK